jgi:hypothetical protein
MKIDARDIILVKSGKTRRETSEDIRFSVIFSLRGRLAISPRIHQRDFKNYSWTELFGPWKK